MTERADERGRCNSATGSRGITPEVGSPITSPTSLSSAKRFFVFFPRRRKGWLITLAGSVNSPPAYEPWLADGRGYADVVQR